VFLIKSNRAGKLPGNAIRLRQRIRRLAWAVWSDSGVAVWVE